MLKFVPIKLMASIFTPEFSFGNHLATINLFQELSHNKFDGELLSIPFQNNAPPEIPRAIVKSKDEKWVLEVSFLRTNLIYLKPDLLSIKEHDVNNFSGFAGSIFKSYKERTDIKIQRMAYITERAAEIYDKTPSQFIADKYCREEYLKKPFNNTKSFEIHSHKKYVYEDFNINSWVRLKSANLLDENHTPVLLVINDFNTLSSQEAPDADFTIEDVSRFFRNISEHINKILTLYF